MPPSDLPDAKADLTLPWKIRLYAWWEGYILPRRRRRAARAIAAEPTLPAVTPPPPPGMTRFNKPLWTATRIEVAAKLWGPGFVTPGAADYIPEIVKPLGLNPAMSVLDLSAGLGGAARAMVARYGAWVNGLEMSTVLAEHGMAQSFKAGMAKQAPVSVYDPESFVQPNRYDCVFAEESFFTVPDKARLLDGVEQCLKPRGQLLFTDYVVDPAVATDGTLQAWFDEEPLEPHPLTIEKTINELLQRNFDVRINEDITDRHRSMILSAIAMLIDHLDNHHMDQETRAAVVDEVELWARRVAALNAGLRVFRFYALKSF